MKPEDIESYQRERKDGLHLRSYSHMRKMIELTQLFLDELFAINNGSTKNGNSNNNNSNNNNEHRKRE